MTKEDLKTLALLPKVIQALRKLSEEAKELHGLAASLSVLPLQTAAQASGAATSHQSGSEATVPQVPRPALSRQANGLSERLPDFSPNAYNAPMRFQSKLEEIRHSPEHTERLAQFQSAQPAEDEDDEMFT